MECWHNFKKVLKWFHSKIRPGGCCERRIIMAKRSRSYISPSFINGKTLFALHRKEPPNDLTPKQQKAWNRLKQYLENKPFTVWCTAASWEYFLNKTLYAGNMSSFIEDLEREVNYSHSDMYYLTEKGKIQKKWKWWKRWWELDMSGSHHCFCF